jgi:hypothetical protein
VGADAGALILHVRASINTRGGRTFLLTADGRPSTAGGQPNPSLVKALKAAHAVARKASMSPEAKADQLIAASAPSDAYQRKLCMLAFLAPDVQAAILEGRQPVGLTLEQLTSDALPSVWADQRRALGF